MQQDQESTSGRPRLRWLGWVVGAAAVAVAAWAGWRAPAIWLDAGTHNVGGEAPHRDTLPIEAGGPSRAESGTGRSGGAEAEAWPLWEFQLRQPLPALDPPLTPPNWRLAGSIFDGHDWRVVVLRQGVSEPSLLRSGDHLPGGYRIVQITAETVTVLDGRRRLTLKWVGS